MSDDEEDNSLSTDTPTPRPRNCRCPLWLQKRFSIIFLLSQPLDDSIVYPRRYLEASHEVFGLSLIITWIVTLIWFPEQIMKHPARPIIGSFNPCFGWDYPPASYIAIVLCSTNCYFTWRYTWLEQTRTLLANGGTFTRAQQFSKVASIMLALSSNLWLLLWLLGPNGDKPHDDDGPIMRNWFIHTGIFMTYAMSSYLAALSNYLEVATGSYRSTVERKSTIFIVVYGIAVGYIATVYISALIMYEFGEPPFLHPMLTQVADFFWMYCVSSITTYMPYEPPLKFHVELVTGTLSDVEA